jgi:hypothetical protein
MTHDKARELFSAYHEGSLEPGLTRALEQKLNGDLALATEYASFASAFDSLIELRDVEIPVPADLTERISARLDRHIWEQDRKKAPAFTGWLRNLAFVGGAALLVLGTVWSFSQRGGQTASSGMVGAGSDGDQVAFARTDSGLRLRFSPGATKTLTIRTEPDLQPVTVLKVSGKVDAPIKNPNGDVGLLRVEVEGVKDPIILALPGQSQPSSVRRSRQAGKAKSTLEDLSVALATIFQVPVELQVDDPQAPASWNFSGLDPKAAAAKALEGRYAVDLGENGVLRIQKN